MLPAPTGSDLILRFTSPALLTDTSGLPVLRPHQHLLADLLGTDVEIHRSWLRHERIGGWNTAANLPKPEEIAISAGSTLQLECGHPPSLEHLEALCASGIGLRRNEGFGSIEFDTRPWRPPIPTTSAARTEHTIGTDAVALAELLLATEKGPWMLTKLADYARHRTSAAAPTDLLNATELRDLRPSTRTRLAELLNDADPHVLEEVVRRLNVLVRREEPPE
jgi:CRISPR-associated protein Csx10